MAALEGALPVGFAVCLPPGGWSFQVGEDCRSRLVAVTMIADLVPVEDLGNVNFGGHRVGQVIPDAVEC